jgi:hypothetical protein
MDSLPAQHINNWNNALSNPQDIKVEVIETGQLHISNHLFLNMRLAIATRQLSSKFCDHKIWEIPKKIADRAYRLYSHFNNRKC